MDLFSNDNNQFSIENVKMGTKEFLESNSMIARLSFILLLLLGFIVLLRIGVNLLTWYYSPGKNVHFIDGMQAANQQRRFIQDPSVDGSKTIVRSNNEDQGIEFTWSVWVFIEDIAAGAGKYRHVFHKGDSPVKAGEDGIIYPNNGPGLYLAPNTNNMYVIMSTYNDYKEEVMVPGIPLQKWVNIIIRVKNKTMDIYVNGVITQSILLNGVPKQNFGDVWMCSNGGFDGYVSNLWYYAEAIGVSKIAEINRKGPNRKMLGQSGMEDKKRDFLSLRWYFYGNRDMYNP
jgi:hypothetical protein|tara:strand:+ start:53638 stop:54498 length:861 start_codon:yes stop_codon:yes gene_type:complete